MGGSPGQADSMSTEQESSCRKHIRGLAELQCNRCCGVGAGLSPLEMGDLDFIPLTRALKEFF